MPYLDDMTMEAIEADLAAAHESLAHGGFNIKKGLISGMEDGPVKTGAKILETVVPAAAFSYMNARSAGGELKVGPVPVDLGVGLALALLSMFDVVGGWDEDLLNIGIGALASYGARTGAAFGAAAAAAAGTTTTSGLPQDAGLQEINGAMPAHGPHNRPTLAARLRGLHHVSGAEISGATAGQPVPPGTQRFVVQRVA